MRDSLAGGVKGDVPSTKQGSPTKRKFVDRFWIGVCASLSVDLSKAFV